MTTAVAAPPSTTAMRSLPPLRGRLLAAYRGLWCLLAAAAVAVLVSLALSPEMDPLILALRLGKGAVLLAVAVILIRRRQEDMVAALLSSAFLLWATTSSFDVTRGDPLLAVGLADRLRFLLFALALLLFPGGDWQPGWTRQVAIASAMVFLLGVAETLGLIDSHLFLPLAILCVLASLSALFLRYRFSANDTERQQMQWVALGLASGIFLILAARAGAALNDSRGSLAFDPVLVEALFQSGVVAIAIGFLVSLLRYRLYDAEAVITRSAAYAVLTLSLGATFAGSEALIEMLGQHYFGAGIGSISGAMAAAVAALLLAPLHGRITGWAERRFQRDLVVLKEHLPELLAELSGGSSTARVATAALTRIEEAVHAARSALVIDGRVVAAHGTGRAAVMRWLKDWRLPARIELFDCAAASEFPLRMALKCPFGSVRGWLLLGPRPDGSLYGRDEVGALATIAPSLRRALFAAREREKERAGEAARRRVDLVSMRKLEARLALIEAKSSEQAHRSWFTQ
jgi:hypothetical protein